MKTPGVLRLLTRANGTATVRERSKSDIARMLMLADPNLADAFA
jgi:hypothetical protein